MARADKGHWKPALQTALPMEDKIPETTNVDIVGEYKPSPFKFGGFKKGVKPSDHELKN